MTAPVANSRLPQRLDVGGVARIDAAARQVVELFHGVADGQIEHGDRRFGRDGDFRLALPLQPIGEPIDRRGRDQDAQHGRNQLVFGLYEQNQSHPSTLTCHRQRKGGLKYETVGGFRR